VSQGSNPAAALTRAYAAALAPFFKRLEMRSKETHTHSIRVGVMAVRLALALSVPEAQLQDIYVGSALHDVGKLFVDDSILHKPGRLDEGELATMRKHPAQGEEFLARSGCGFSPVVLAAARSHHERWDGSGYPDMLAGEQIPLVARIVAVVDTFDTVVANRRYDPPRRREIAFSELETCAGGQFDPRLAREFVRLMRPQGTGELAALT
jgi:putative two-component system response regulator